MKYVALTHFDATVQLVFDMFVFPAYSRQGIVILTQTWILDDLSQRIQAFIRYYALAGPIHLVLLLIIIHRNDGRYPKAESIHRIDPGAALGDPPDLLRRQEDDLAACEVLALLVWDGNIRGDGEAQGPVDGFVPVPLLRDVGAGEDEGAAGVEAVPELVVSIVVEFGGVVAAGQGRP